MSKELRITIVSFDEFTSYDHIPLATFYIKNAMGEILYLHNSKREVCQAWVDENYGKGKYSVIASKDQKTKSKSGSGMLSATGTATRKK